MQHNHHKEIEDRCNKIASSCSDGINYSYEMGDPTNHPKYGLLHHVFEKKADFLVLGGHGLAHGIKEHLKDGLYKTMGSVPGYCASHCPCSVIIVKENKDY